jgi:predicted GTPase
MKRRNVIIMGAAGRDFHNFNVCFRTDPAYRVKAFTAAQIPYIAGRRYPSSLAGPLYPRGIPVYPEEQLEQLFGKYPIHQVVFAYSDIAHSELMHTVSRVLALGADFRFLGPDATMLKSRRPVIAITAVRTGCGKSQVVRYLCDLLRSRGLRPVVVRHPMPYGRLAAQAVERLADASDVDRYRCTIEEREEFEPLLRRGAVVYAGVDYGRILREAEREGEVILWDGGNNDLPFFRPDLHITIVDPLRPGDETAYYPGEVNLRRASVVVINKANAVDGARLDRMERAIAAINPVATIIRTDSLVTVTDAEGVRGKTVLVVEDGPSITHGSRASGAGLAAAHTFRARAVVDPRPYAVGSLAEAFRKYPHIGPVLPALGYSAAQIEELRRTIEAVPCDSVLSATPGDLMRLMRLSKPVVTVNYEIGEGLPARLWTLVDRFLAGHDL